MNVEKQIRLYDDLYDLWYEPFWHKPWFIIFAGCLATVFLVGLIWLVIRSIKKKKKVLTPWQEALKNLMALNIASYEMPSRHKDYYQQLTGILKRYVSRRYGCFLASKTDQEVINALKETELAHDLQEQLEDIMQGAVFVKFANQQAAHEKMKLDLQRAQELIQKTIPKKN